jgi:Flp pilus assembly protein TadG
MIGLGYVIKTRPGLSSLLFTLAKDRLACIRQPLARFWRDEEGSWFVYMSLLMPVLIGVAGLGTEGGLLFYQHRSLQSAADAAAYSAALCYSNNTTSTPCSSSTAQAQAQAVVASYGYALGTGTNQANVSANVTPNDSNYGGLTSVQVTASRPQSAIFSSIYFPTLSNSVSATAVINGDSTVGGSSSGGCILALGKTSTGGSEQNSIYLQGNPTINTPGCGIYSNSADCTYASGSFAEDLGGNATINAASLGTAGCTNIFGHASVNLQTNAGDTVVSCTAGSSTACTQGGGTVSDPYARLWTSSSLSSALSTYPTCQNQPSGSSITLAAGRYCGLNANGINITLSGGIYIVDCTASTCPTSGQTTAMLIVKNATLTDNGAGSTLVFTCSTCTTASQWPGDALANLAGGSISLSAPSTGATAGFAIIGDPSMPLNTAFDSHSNPNICLLGTSYAPAGEFQLGGTPNSGCSTSSSTFCQQFIANTVDFYGNATDSFNANGCSLSGGGTGQIQKSIGSKVTLVD